MNVKILMTKFVQFIGIAQHLTLEIGISSIQKRWTSFDIWILNFVIILSIHLQYIDYI
jgi:hypothetical protein